jgi:hypothetical protein
VFPTSKTAWDCDHIHPRGYYFPLVVDGVEIRIPISEQTFSNYNLFFLSKNPSKWEKTRFYTLKNIAKSSYDEGDRQGREEGYRNGLEEGYRKGLEDGAKRRPPPPQR